MKLKTVSRIPREYFVILNIVAIGTLIYICCFISISSTRGPNQLKPKSLSRRILRENDKRNIKKTILFWYKPFEEDTEIKSLPSNCGNCQVTNDRNKFNESKAVVFHFNELNMETMAKHRLNDQLFVFFTKEAPPALKRRELYFKEYDNYFNLTMSYRTNADIHSPYYRMKDVIFTIQERYKNTKDFGISSTLKLKNKLLLMVVSNCGSVQGAKERIRISDLLKNTTIGDRFDREGSCFNNERFQVDKFKEYKFYLAMENSFHCKDYITEKLYRNGFLMESVPIVWGAKKSDYIVPPKSVIFMEDYKSMDDLADYLDYLDKNDTAYLEYFQWRKTDLSNVFSENVRDQRWFSIGSCNLCSFIHENNEQEKSSEEKRKVVKSIYSWIYEQENPECLK